MIFSIYENYVKDMLEKIESAIDLFEHVYFLYEPHQEAIKSLYSMKDKFKNRIQIYVAAPIDVTTDGEMDYVKPQDEIRE